MATSSLQTYGTAPGAISPKRLAESLRLNDVQWDDGSGALIWHEAAGEHSSGMKLQANWVPYLPSWVRMRLIS